MKTTIHHVILLDQSGSMISIQNEAITGYNEVIQQIKKDAETFEDEQDHTATLVVFDGNVEKLYWLEDIANLENLDENSYRPDGLTSLRDAIGCTIHDLRNDLGSQLESPDTKVFITVITDGMDTASKEYNIDGLQTVVANLKEDEEDSPWTLTLIGANIDSMTTAESFGMRGNMTRGFAANAVDTQAMFKGVAASRSTYSTAVSKGYSKFQTDSLTSHVAQTGETMTDDQMDEFVNNLKSSSDSDSDSDSDGS